MLPLKVEPFLHVPNQHILRCVLIVGQDTPVSKTLEVTAPKTNISCWTREATGKIELGSC